MKRNLNIWGNIKNYSLKNERIKRRNKNSVENLGIEENRGKKNDKLREKIRQMGNKIKGTEENGEESRIEFIILEAS